MVRGVISVMLVQSGDVGFTYLSPTGNPGENVYKITSLIEYAWVLDIALSGVLCTTQSTDVCLAAMPG